MFGAINSVLGIGVSVFLRDNFSPQAAKINQNFQKLDGDIQRRIRSQTQTIANIATATTAAGLGIMYGMRRAVGEVDAFQRILYKTKSITGLNNIEMAKMQQMALDLSYKYPYSATEIADSFLELSKAGISGTKDMNAMTRAVLGFATAADIAVGGEEGATNMLLNVMAMFGKKIPDAEMIAAKIAKAANLTTVSPTQIYEAFKYAIPVMKQFNIGLDESLTLVSGLAQAGIKGTLAGTTFSNFFRFLGDAVGEFQKPKQAKALAMLGLSPGDFKTASGGLKDRIYLLHLLRERIKGLGDVKKQGILETIFGVRGERATLAMNFLNATDVKGMPAKTLGDIAANLAKQKDATDLRNLVQIRMLQPAEQMKLWNKAMFEMKVSMVEVIQTGIIPLMNFLVKGVRLLASFSHTGIGKFLIGAGIIVVVLGTIAAAVISLMASLALIRMSGGYALFAQGGGLLKGVANIFQFLTRNLFGTFTMFARNGALMSLMKSGRWTFIASWGAALSKFFSGGLIKGISGIIALMGPWGRAIAVVVAGLTALYFASDSIHNSINSIGKWFADMFSYIGIYTRWLGANVKAALTLDFGGFAMADLALENSKNRLSGTASSRPIKPQNNSVYITDPQGKTTFLLSKISNLLEGKKDGDVVVNFVTPSGKIISTQTINREQQKQLVQTLGYKLQ